MGSVATPHWTQTRSCATLFARHRDDGESRSLELSGEADMATWDLLRQEVAWMGTVQHARVVVDVTGLAFCDVASAELILAERRTTPVAVVGATGSVKLVFDVLEALQVRRPPGHRALSPPPSRPLVRVSLTA